MDVVTFNVMGIDPGVTTGLAIINQRGDFNSVELSWYDAAVEIEGTAQACRMTQRPLVIAGERFDLSQRTIRANPGDVRSSIGINEIARYMAMRCGFNFEERVRDSTKSFATDDLLKKLGWYRVGGGGHHNDASRVLALQLSISDPLYWRRLVLECGVLRDDGEEQSESGDRRA